MCLCQRGGVPVPGECVQKGPARMCMELLKQKSLVIGVCRLTTDEETNEQATLPAYFFEVNGVQCGLTFAFWKDETWRLVDRMFGTVLGAYETFDEAAAAVVDGAWVREEHESLLQEHPEVAQNQQDIDRGEEVFRTDNPLKGRPGITLIPDYSLSPFDDYNDDMDDEYALDEEELEYETWDDSADWDDDDDDWDDEDWDDEEEGDWNDAQTASVTVNEETPDESVRVSAAEENEDNVDEDGDDADLDEDDWEHVEDDEYDAEDDEEDNGPVPATLVPRAAYILDVARHAVAVFPTLVTGAMAWWEAFDVETGTPLWTSQSISELIRIAPLFFVLAHSVPDVSQETQEYLMAISIAFSEQSRQKPMDYLRTGYIKATGREYLGLMNAMFMDPVTLENAMSGEVDDE